MTAEFAPRPGRIQRTAGATAVTRELVQGIARAAAATVPGVAEVRTAPDLWRPVRSWLPASAIPVDPDGTRLTIDVAVEVRYGTQVPALVEKVRRAVAKQVQEATGCAVEAVNVTVAGVRPAPEPGTRARI